MVQKSIRGLAAIALMLGALPAAAEKKIIKIDGSSTVYPVTEAVAEEFMKTHPDIQVTVGISGTGGGFKKFCRGETDISDASRPILRKEMDACLDAGVQYFELPVAFDALTVMINPKNTWAATMTVAELKKIWEPAAQGQVTKWNQANPAWPDKALKLYGAGSDRTVGWRRGEILQRGLGLSVETRLSDMSGQDAQGGHRDDGGVDPQESNHPPDIVVSEWTPCEQHQGLIAHADRSHPILRHSYKSAHISGGDRFA